MAEGPAPWAAKIRYLRGHPAYRDAPLRTVARLAWWRVRARGSRPVRVTFPCWGVRLDVPPLWRGVPKLIYAFRDHYEPELRLLDTLLSSGSAVVDAGASMGIYTMVASSIVGPSGRVLAVEPAEESRRWLERNVALNRASNVEVSSIALSDRVGVARLLHHPDPGRASIAPIEGRDRADGEDVSTAPLDRILDGTAWARLELVKIDVEGAETAVVAGARQTLETFRPVVIVELHPASARVGSGDGTAGMLRELGYRLLSMDRREGTLLPMGRRVAWGNVIAVHGSDVRTQELLGAQL